MVYNYLNKINYPKDLKKFKIDDLKKIAEELRTKTIEAVSKTGGHLGAGLGVVELTIAVHYVFDTPDDKLLWDVGHQSYPHKILTGRKDQIETIRQGGGLYGFVKRSESEYDPFGTAHSSTSISAGLGIKIAKDSIVYVPSGVVDGNNGRVLSYLHKAIKPVNQLRMIEDALVIYRISRAPERRIFYIDVGNLPKVKAEQYLKDVMNRYRNKLVYDASTGEIRDDRNHMSMLEDFWLPRREGGRGTEITTLPGGQNLGEIDDIQYFQRKLYRSLNVPISRLESESGFNLGRSTEITRDELKFTKFVQRIRKKFIPLFTDILKTQLLLKGIIAQDDWPEIKEHLQYDFLMDGHFTELKEAELLRERLETMDTIQSYMGTFFSKQYVWEKVLRMNDGEVAKMQDQIKSENEMDVEDGGIEMPDGGDGITRYPQDGDGKVIKPTDMPDYEDPAQDGIPDDPDSNGGNPFGKSDDDDEPEVDDQEIDSDFIVKKKGKKK